ncbi:MAG: hypothetical protein HQL69_13215 [Magnetococcales bacterium]|nr:hypothetical protein [Magnetococcales bacterium]
MKQICSQKYFNWLLQLFILIVSIFMITPVNAAKDVGFVYGLTGAPAANLTVDILDKQGKVHNTNTDGDGFIKQSIAGANIRISDPKSKLLLLVAASNKPPKELKVALPIRFKGSLAGFGQDSDKIKIHIGYGKLIEVTDFQRAKHNMKMVAHPDENSPHKLPLPPISQRWLSFSPQKDGSFISPWLAVSDPPQIFIVNSNGRMTAKHILLPKKISAQQTIDIGKFTPQVGATLEVDLKVGKTDLPLGLEMGVSSLYPVQVNKREFAIQLGMLNVNSPKMARLLMKRGTIPLQLDGVTRITGFLPAQSLELYFVGPTPGIIAKRTVYIPAKGTVRITLDEKELLGERGAGTNFSGTVVLGDNGNPVVGAKVVYSSYPDRKETTTSLNGSFIIPNIQAQQNAIVFIDAPYADGTPPFDRITKSFILKGESNSNKSHQTQKTFTIPLPLTKTEKKLNEFSKANRADNSLKGNLRFEFPGCSKGYDSDNGHFAQKPIVTVYSIKDGILYRPKGKVKFSDIIPLQNGDLQVNIKVKEEGEYFIAAQFSPFVYAWTKEYFSAPKSKKQLLLKLSDHKFQENLKIVISNKEQQPAKNVLVKFTGIVQDVDPFVMVSDSKGEINIRCINNLDTNSVSSRYFHISVDDHTQGKLETMLPKNRGDTLRFELN